MDIKLKITLITLVIALTLAYSIKPDFTITGYSVVDRIDSYTVGRSFSSLGPIMILSFIFAGALVALYELKKK